ncbi:MAG: hypothetical protein PHO76_13045 [Methylotenera sp.]|nr:hypothetical protein [Methylotenera sp.]MDD4926143.1 hypothetical protein [Methylotenera sp.]
MNYLHNLKVEMSQIDTLLVKIDNVLDSAQPNLAGKIRIKFWHSHGKDKPQEPFLVSRTKEPTKIPKRISELHLAKKAKCRGEFSDNYMTTYALLCLTAELLSYRKRLKSLISNIESRARATLNGNYYRLIQAEKDIIKMDKVICTHLNAEGKEGYYRPIGKPIFTH